MALHPSIMPSFRRPSRVLLAAPRAGFSAIDLRISPTRLPEEPLFGTLVQVSRGLGEVLFLQALNEKISSAFRATVISLSQLGIRASFCLLGPLVGYGIDAWGLPSVLSALGILFSIAFAFLLLPLVLRETAPSPGDGLRA